MEPSAIELLSRCDDILGFGEITESEAYDLAEWLNENEAACRCWPGAALVSSLQEIWADGKVTRTELRRLGALLRSVQKQWAKIYRNDAISNAQIFAQSLAPTMPPETAKLPVIAAELRIRSHSDPSQFYNVDLSGPTCDCADWRGCRQKLPSGHLTRCCKHVLDALGVIVPESLWRGWIGAFIHVGSPAMPGTEWQVIQVSGCKWLMSDDAGRAEGWINVYAEEDGRFERFGYSLTERRWAYAAEPRAAATLLRAVQL